MATETIERPRVSGPGSGLGGSWHVIVLIAYFYRKFTKPSKKKIFIDAVSRASRPDRIPSPTLCALFGWRPDEVLTKMDILQGVNRFAKGLKNSEGLVERDVRLSEILGDSLEFPCKVNDLQKAILAHTQRTS